MLMLRQVLPRTHKTSWWHTRCFTFHAGDFCMLRELKSNRKYLLGPLIRDEKRDVKNGMLLHNDVIDKSVRAVVRTHNGSTGFMLHVPTLDDYVLNVPRKCTPIYPKDASTIVQMLDIEPGHRILEAGTGNGSLTLYLARAVSNEGKVYTFDVQASHSRAAQEHVRNYARGRYHDVVDFHIGPVSEALANQQPTELFDGIALDMPDPTASLPGLLPHLRNDRFIVCYLPNMTQVLHLVKTIKEMPLILEACIEAEWKEWDIRATHVRNKTDTEDDTAWVCRPKNFDVKGHTAFLVKLRKCAPIVQPILQEDEDQLPSTL